MLDPANQLRQPQQAPQLRAKNHNGKSVSEHEIRLCAFQKWEAAGTPSGDGVQFWLEAEREMVEVKTEMPVQGGGWQGYREHERRDADKEHKEDHVSADSHYKDNNRMFQNHGDRGHRHGAKSE